MKNIGIDIVSVKEFKKFRKNKTFFEKIFTENEIKYCLSKKNSCCHFAGKFALKEAFIKCMKKSPKIKEIEILNDKKMKPYILWKGKRIKALTSISHDENNAIAVCLLI
ncbi:holo-ACP synthase [Candidatus Aenigmatarchaeota archaeon]